jgi:hypothetical protein
MVDIEDKRLKGVFFADEVQRSASVVVLVATSKTSSFQIKTRSERIENSGPPMRVVGVEEKRGLSGDR